MEGDEELLGEEGVLNVVVEQGLESHREHGGLLTVLVLVGFEMKFDEGKNE